MGKTDIVKKLIMQGASVNARNEEGLTPLHVAVRNNNYEMVDILTHLGADVNIRNRLAQDELADLGSYSDPWWEHINRGILTPLEYGLIGFAREISQERTRHKILELLIERGTDLNPRGVLFTPLHVAASMTANTDIIYLLIQNGAYVNLINNRGATPIDFAIAYQQDDNLITLLTYGANPPSTALMQIVNMLKNGSSNTILAQPILLHLFSYGAKMSTLDTEDINYLKAILTSPPLNISPIILHLIFGDDSVFGELANLIGQQIDPTHIENYFLFALGQGSEVVVGFILDNFGSLISQSTRNIALIRAAQFGYQEILSYFYYSIDPSPEVLNIAFRMAANAEQQAALSFLFLTGKITSETIMHVLQQATRWGQLSILESLSKQGTIPLEIIAKLFIEAARYGQLGVIDFFNQATTISKEAFEAAVLEASINGHIEVVRYILAGRAMLNVESAGKAIKNKLANKQLSDEQADRYNEIFILLNKHQLARLAIIRLERISEVRERAGQSGLPAELIASIADIVGRST